MKNWEDFKIENEDLINYLSEKEIYESWEGYFDYESHLDLLAFMDGKIFLFSGGPDNWPEDRAIECRQDVDDLLFLMK